MDSRDSTLPTMEEDESHAQSITTIREEDEEIAVVTAAEDTESLATAVEIAKTRLSGRRRRRRETQTDTDTQLSAGNSCDDPWWWEIENQDLILDQAPNVSRLFSESANRLSDNSNEPPRMAEKVDLTLMSDGNVSGSGASIEALGETDANHSEDEPTDGDHIDGPLCTLNCTDTEIEIEKLPKREQTLDEFKEELRIKRLARQTAVQDLRDELSMLRQQLASEQAIKHHLRSGECNVSGSVTPAELADAAIGGNVIDADDEDPMSRGRHANIELASAQLALQEANSENISLRAELGVVRKQVGTLKEVIVCCKQMLTVKEEQCNQLKDKLTEIENSMSEKEMRIMSDNLRQEYEKQLGNIRQLRELYEERQRVAAAEHDNLQRLVSIKKDELQGAQEKIKSVEERNDGLMKEVETLNKELGALREECNEHKFEKRTLKEEMGAVNTLFSQMVMGFNGKNNLDIDRLTTMLEENRTLLNDMATKEVNCTDGATLPKLLFELVEQATISNETYNNSAAIFTTTSDSEGSDNEAEPIKVKSENADTNSEAAIDDELSATANEMNGTQTATATKTVKKLHRKGTKSQKEATTVAMQLHEPKIIGTVASTQEIIGNLPKVWKVILELLSHHKIEQVQFEEGSTTQADCYKSVETPNGPKAELSVSKTYIKLKDLILEKKSLVKETNHLKTLNSHLDYRLNEQQKRLSAVSLELTKTWHLVGKMQRQHRQLHTQEQILRYQLQQKRRLLTELKEELEYCRRKWAAARAKNDESQEQCNDLRREFAKRKLEDANNSAESGYSDSGPPSDEEERNGGAAETAASSSTNRCKLLKEMFEHTRKIKRMQSSSPGRALEAEGATGGTEVILRWNSAPPTCGWRGDADEDDEEEGESATLLLVPSSKGAIPKSIARQNSRSRENSEQKQEDYVPEAGLTPAGDAAAGVSSGGEERTSRILKLEEQCKSLIQQVLETSDNRERLEVQLCRFQDDIAPVQYAVPLDEYINRKRLERMTRASSAPATGTLTPREEEYTRKRSERLERLEEESRQLMSRIRRTCDRGHYLRCSLDRIRRAPSREGSFESNTEEDVCKTDESEGKSTEGTAAEELQSNDVIAATSSPLTDTEEAYTARRAARIQRLEEEGRQLLSTLAHNNERGETFKNKLDVLHERYGSDEVKETEAAASTAAETAAVPVQADTIEQRMENIEKVSTNRAERLRILEEEGKQLLTRLTNTSERGTQMINRIAEREQNRLARNSATSGTVTGTAKPNGSSSVAMDNPIPAPAAILPTIQNVACTSIVSEELTDCVTVTTTPSQMATSQGAIPKSQPVSVLSPTRAIAAKKLVKPANSAAEGEESLEAMVQRLTELPFPKQETAENVETGGDAEAHNSEQQSEDGK